MANVTEMPTQEGQVDAQIPAESAPEPATSAPNFGRKPPNKGGRPKPSATGTPNPDPTFFKKVAAIPAEDWGTRAYMYVYIDEPVCVEKTWGQYSYALKCKQPMLDLEPLKERYGSHKGWLSLNTRKSGKDATDQIDRYDYEIFDPLCPPKIPRGSWANDGRNDKWRALLPAETPSASAAATSLVDAIKVYKDIRDEVKDEMPATEPVTNGTRETLETMKLAKELFAPPAAEKPDAPIDPFDTAKKIMEMRTNDPMIALLISRMDAQDKAMEAARLREFELQKELREKATAPAAPAKGFFEQLIDFGGETIKTRIVNGLFGGNAANGTEPPVRAGHMNTLEFISDFGPKALHTFSPLIDAFASKVMANGTQANPGAAVQPRPNDTGSQVDKFQRFIGDIVTPKMLMYFSIDPSAEGGETFADWIYAGFPEFFERLQHFRHPFIPGQEGSQAIITAYKNTPEVWPRISAKEAEFIAFVEAFCKWKPEPEEDDNIQDAEIIEPAGEQEEERIS